MKNANKKYLIIVNPVSGSGRNKNVISHLEMAFPSSPILVTERVGHPYDITLNHSLHSINGIIAMGGDGTMHEVINGMMDRKDSIKLPIGLIPGGTGNSFMHDLDCLDPIKAIELIQAGGIKEIDLMQVKMPEGTSYAYNIVGWGISVTINNLAEKWRKLGGQRYNLAALYEIIRNPSWPVKIKLDDTIIEGDYSFFLACNTVYSGNGMKVAPKAILDDGLIDILLLKQAPRYQLIKLFTKIFSGEHIKSPVIEYHQVKSFSIIPQNDSVLNIDGQVSGHTPIEVTILNKAIKVFYPL